MKSWPELGSETYWLHRRGVAFAGDSSWMLSFGYMAKLLTASGALKSVGASRDVEQCSAVRLTSSEFCYVVPVRAAGETVPAAGLWNDVCRRLGKETPP